jgi:hypothetical protein
VPVNGPALFSARAAIEIALKALEVHRWEGTEVDQFPVNRRYDQAAANDISEWPTIREFCKSAG